MTDLELEEIAQGRPPVPDLTTPQGRFEALCNLLLRNAHLVTGAPPKVAFMMVKAFSMTSGAGTMIEIAQSPTATTSALADYAKANAALAAGALNGRPQNREMN